MCSLKEASALLTNEYVRMLFVELDVKAKGGYASCRDINQINRIRAEVNLADERLKRQLRGGVFGHDPDADCR